MLSRRHFDQAFGRTEFEWRAEDLVGRSMEIGRKTVENSEMHCNVDKVL